jgi:hypothetical protein
VLLTYSKIREGVLLCIKNESLVSSSEKINPSEADFPVPALGADFGSY